MGNCFAILRIFSLQQCNATIFQICLPWRSVLAGCKESSAKCQEDYKECHASACWHFCIPSVSKCKQPQSVPNFKGSTLIAFAFTCKHPYACIQYLYCHCVLLGTTFDACPHLTFQSKDPEAPNSKTLLKAQNTKAFLWKRLWLLKLDNRAWLNKKTWKAIICHLCN